MHRLNNRELNRALLRRQLLLDDRAAEPVTLLRHLCGLNGQYPDSPYFGVSARLPGFEIADLEGKVAAGHVTRMTLMRGTLHLVDSEDAAWLRPTLQPAIERVLRGFFPRDARLVDPARIAAETERALADGAADRNALASALAKVYPDAGRGFLAHAARAYSVLAHEPEAALFRGARVPRYRWVSRLPEADPDRVKQWRRRLVRRYLAAFGPATVADMQYWSGLTGLRTTVAELSDELTTVIGPSGDTLWDTCTTGPIEDVEVTPIQLLPDYDNILFAHADRTRIVADEVRRRVVVVAKRMQRIVLRDGFVAGTWTFDPGPYEGRTTVVVRLPNRVTAVERSAAEAEVARLGALLSARGAEVDGPMFVDPT